MPNWCSNYITISGNERTINVIKSALDGIEDKTKSNVFETLIGIPPDITKEEYENDWYDSNLKRFGTKWDVSYIDCSFNFYDDYITMMPETAWSPPTEFCINLCKMYGVSVKMEYSEPGCNFAGITEIDTEGLIVEEKDYGYLEGIYHQDAELFWHEVQSDLESEFENDSEYILDTYIKDYEVDFLTEMERKELCEFFEEIKKDIVK